MLNLLKDKPTGWQTLPMAALATALLLSLGGCGYNTFQTTDEQVKAGWSEVVNPYQSRADLIPNLVNTVKGEAKFEQDTRSGSGAGK